MNDGSSPTAPPSGLAPPTTGHPGIDSALAEVADTDDPVTLTKALDVLQGVLDDDGATG